MYFIHWLRVKVFKAYIVPTRNKTRNYKKIFEIQ